MASNEEIIKEARKWRGKKWIHGQCVEGQGADCIQFITFLAKKFDWIPQTYSIGKYSRDWAIHNEKSLMKEKIKEYADQVDLETILIGDVLLFSCGSSAGHAGIYIGDGLMVHSTLRHGISEELVGTYTKELDSVWRIKK